MRQRTDELILTLLGLFEALVLLDQRLNFRTHVGTIAQNLSKPDELATLVANRRKYTGGPKPAAVLTQHPAIVFRFAVGSCDVLFVLHHARSPVLWREQDRHVLPD